MKPASEKRTRAWAGTRFSNFQLANSGYTIKGYVCGEIFAGLGRIRRGKPRSGSGRRRLAVKVESGQDERPLCIRSELRNPRVQNVFDYCAKGCSHL